MYIISKIVAQNKTLRSLAPRARPGIHALPRVGLHVHVRPGIQARVAHVEPPPV